MNPKGLTAPKGWGNPGLRLRPPRSAMLSLMRWECASMTCRSNRRTSTGQSRIRRKKIYAAFALTFALLPFPASHTMAAESPADGIPRGIQTVPGMPPVIDPNNIYSETRPDKLSAAVAKHISRVYVPNRSSNDVWVIDPTTDKVVNKFRVGVHPQHVVPSWDLKTLWVNNNAEGRDDGSVTPIDPLTGKPGKNIPVDDPYNMYFTPDGSAAIIVAEARKRLDFRDPQTMAMKYSIDTPSCSGINHADFSIDGRYAIFTCEYAGSLAKIDLVEKKVVGYLKLSKS